MLVINHIWLICSEERTYSHHAVACGSKVVKNNLNFSFDGTEFFLEQREKPRITKTTTTRGVNFSLAVSFVNETWKPN